MNSNKFTIFTAAFPLLITITTLLYYFGTPNENALAQDHHMFRTAVEDSMNSIESIDECLKSNQTDNLNTCVLLKTEDARFLMKPFTSESACLGTISKKIVGLSYVIDTAFFLYATDQAEASDLLNTAEQKIDEIAEINVRTCGV